MLSRIVLEVVVMFEIHLLVVEWFD